MSLAVIVLVERWNLDAAEPSHQPDHLTKEARQMATPAGSTRIERGNRFRVHADGASVLRPNSATGIFRQTRRPMPRSANSPA